MYDDNISKVKSTISTRTERSRQNLCNILKTMTKLEASEVTKRFPTQNKYSGGYNQLGMTGNGKYRFASGIQYEGQFLNGKFHGNGVLVYPSGYRLYGRWHNGECVERLLSFGDGLDYSGGKWTYCSPEDRRFVIEHQKGMRPAGESYKTNVQPSPIIPPGMYDTVDGFYCPKLRVVFQQDDLTELVRIPSKEECEWIELYCRYSDERTSGPRPDIYEEWDLPNVKDPCEEEASILNT